MKALFGNSFTVLPGFNAPNSDELQSALDADSPAEDHRDILGGQDSDRICLWIQQVASTHPSVRRLETALMMAQAWQKQPY